MPRNYRPGLDVVRLAALLPVLCYHYCIEAARLGFAVPTALIGRGMADWVEIGLAWFFCCRVRHSACNGRDGLTPGATLWGVRRPPTRHFGWGLRRCLSTVRSCTATTPISRAGAWYFRCWGWTDI